MSVSSGSVTPTGCFSGRCRADGFFSLPRSGQTTRGSLFLPSDTRCQAFSSRKLGVLYLREHSHKKKPSHIVHIPNTINVMFYIFELFFFLYHDNIKHYGYSDRNSIQCSIKYDRIFLLFGLRLVLLYN